MAFTARSKNFKLKGWYHSPEQAVRATCEFQAGTNPSHDDKDCSVAIITPDVAKVVKLHPPQVARIIIDKRGNVRLYSPAINEVYNFTSEPLTNPKTIGGLAIAIGMVIEQQFQDKEAGR